MRKSPLYALIPLLVAVLCASIGIGFASGPLFGVIAAILCILLFGTAAVMIYTYTRDVEEAMDDVFRQNESAAGAIFAEVDIPVLLFDGEGHIVWGNPAFRELYNGRDLRAIFPNMNPHLPPKSLPLEMNGRNFQVMNIPVRRNGPRLRQISFQYWIDRTEALHYARLYEEQRPTVAIVSVDNFEDLATDKQFKRSEVLSQVERLVADWVYSVGGVYRRYESSKYFVVFEAQRINEMERQRFPILDAAHNIDTGTGQPVTLSIAVGVADRINSSDEAARQTMELALGRGGDQAVVRVGTAYAFYGGKRQVATRNSRVKTRLFARALRNLMENADQVFIMGHKQSDMDVVGAALGIMCCADFIGCKAYLVIDEPNLMIQGALDAMHETDQYTDAVKTPEQALGMAHASSILVIVDTQRRSTVVSTELYDKISSTVIIDHHRRSVDALQNATLNHLEAGASSACEMVTEVIQYFDDSIKPNAFVCGALLAGLTMDTKRFTSNTGARTFEAASYLKRNGADMPTVKMLLQDDMATYRERTQVVQNALIMEKGIAISTCPRDVEDPALIAAQAADELISLREVSASFVLTQLENTVHISGRSTGDINVQIILEALGGGGHLTVAGAQLKGETIDSTIQKLTDQIRIYLKEADIQ